MANPNIMVISEMVSSNSTKHFMASPLCRYPAFSARGLMSHLKDLTADMAILSLKMIPQISGLIE